MARISLAICFALLVASSTIYVASGTFFFPRYFKKMPTECKDVEPFAYQGMTSFFMTLEGGCPKTPEFKNFFSKLKDYMNSVNKVSTMTDGRAIISELKAKTDALDSVMAQLDKSQGDADKLVEKLKKMAWTLMDYKKGGSVKLTVDKQREVEKMLGSCAEGIGLFVKEAAKKKGGFKLDLTVFGIGGFAGSGSSSKDTTKGSSKSSSSSSGAVKGGKATSPSASPKTSSSNSGAVKGKKDDIKDGVLSPTGSATAGISSSKTSKASAKTSSSGSGSSSKKISSGRATSPSASPTTKSSSSGTAKGGKDEIKDGVLSPTGSATAGISSSKSSKESAKTSSSGSGSSSKQTTSVKAIGPRASPTPSSTNSGSTAKGGKDEIKDGVLSPTGSATAGISSSATSGAKQTGQLKV